MQALWKIKSLFEVNKCDDFPWKNSILKSLSKFLCVTGRRYLRDKNVPYYRTWTPRSVHLRCCTSVLIFFKSERRLFNLKTSMPGKRLPLLHGTKYKGQELGIERLEYFILKSELNCYDLRGQFQSLREIQKGMRNHLFAWEKLTWWATWCCTRLGFTWSARFQNNMWKNSQKSSEEKYPKYLNPKLWRTKLSKPWSIFDLT